MTMQEDPRPEKEEELGPDIGESVDYSPAAPQEDDEEPDAPDEDGDVTQV